jgi:hypothetical protein
MKKMLGRLLAMLAAVILEKGVTWICSKYGGKVGRWK